MSGLKILLLTSAQDDFQFFQYFPQSYEQPYKVNELLLYTKYFKNCGKGCLISKDKIYFYKTFTPNLENNANQNKKKIFLFFYCDTYYNQKYIDEFTDNIFELLELDVFNENVLKKKIVKTIDELFDIYKNIDNKEEIYKEYVNDIMKNGKEEYNSGSNNTSMDSQLSYNKNKSMTRNRENSLMSIRNTNLMENMENIEMVKINELDTDLTMIFKSNKYDNYFMKLKIYKKIKLINLVIFAVIGIVIYCLIPVAVKNKK